MSSQGWLDKIRGKPVEQPIYNYGHKIIELSDTITESQLEQLTSKINLGKYKTFKDLYEKDEVTFALVNYLISKIAGQGLLFNGDKRLKKHAEEWSKTIGFKFVNWFIVKDAILGGTCWIEIVPNKEGTTIDSFKFLNPDDTDFIRNKDNDIQLDENGEILGFKMMIHGKERKWYKDRIEVGGKVVIKSKKEDLRKRIIWLKIEGYGSNELGIPYLLAGHRTAIIKANIEDMIGESSFRGGGIVAYYEGSPSEEILDSMAKDLKNITSKNVFLLSNKWKLDLAPIADIQQQDTLIKTLADLECGSAGVPMDILFTTAGGTYRQDLPQKLMDLEQRVAYYQEYLAYQINSKVLSYLKWLWNTNGELEMKYVTRMPNIKMHNARSIASWGRAGLITWDPELEKEIREREELPVTFVQKELDDWTTNKRSIEHKERGNNFFNTN